VSPGKLPDKAQQKETLTGIAPAAKYEMDYQSTISLGKIDNSDCTWLACKVAYSETTDPAHMR